MFWHLFKYKLKVLLNRKAMLFWALIFPFILSIFFKLTLGNIGEIMELKVIDIAVINDKKYNDNSIFKGVIENLSKGSDKLFNTKYLEKDSAYKLLNDNKVEGIVYLNDKNIPNMVVSRNGINQTIIKSVLDEYQESLNVVNRVIKNNPDSISNGILDKIKTEYDIIKDESNEKIDFSLNYFYTLIAMTCLYGSLIGLEIIKDTEGNLSKKGARMCMSPVSKGKIILSSLTAGFLIEIISLTLLYLFLIFVLKVNLGSKVLPMVIITIFGCISGLSLGIFTGVTNKKGEDFKIGVLIAVIMLCCFLSGMMGDPGMKLTIDENIPIVQYVNPISIITDGLYSLYAYDNLDVYFKSLFRIISFSFILVLVSFKFIRRKKYDSI